MGLPTVICSSTIRSSKQGESHGGLFVVDLNTDKVEQVFDWDDAGINWEGHGGERGLRGICIHADKIYAASAKKIIVFDKNFNILGKYAHPYLDQAHELDIDPITGILYITSTSYDSVISFDTNTCMFKDLYCFRSSTELTEFAGNVLFGYKRIKPEFFICDLSNIKILEPKDTLHLNNVFYKDGAFYFSGVVLDGLYKLDLKFRILSKVCEIPVWTHNVKFYKDGIMANITDDHRIEYINSISKIGESYRVKKYATEEVMLAPDVIAIQCFNRGLCFHDDYIIGGSTPATISVYKQGEQDPIKALMLSKDIRNSIHGLEVFTK